MWKNNLQEKCTARICSKTIFVQHFLKPNFAGSQHIDLIIGMVVIAVLLVSFTKSIGANTNGNRSGSITTIKLSCY